MPIMPSRISKGPILAKIEDYLNKGNAKAVKEALQKKPVDELFDIYAALIGVVAGSAYYNHLKNDWFNPTSGWWIFEQPLDPIVRQGLIEACDLMLTHKLPIDCYWVCAGGPVEVWVEWSSQEITFIIATPPPPAGDFLKLTDPESIYVVRSGGPNSGEDLVRTSLPVPGYPINTVQPRSEPRP